MSRPEALGHSWVKTPWSLFNKSWTLLWVQMILTLVSQFRGGVFSHLMAAPGATQPEK